jgi:anti-sigma regulatory factor (Ser/Thr protein kinase)
VRRGHRIGAGQRLARLRIPARADRLAQVRRRVAHALAPLALDRALADGLVLAVDEACANVVRHGYAGADEEGDIVVSLWREGAEIVVRVRDFAPPVDLRRLAPRDPRALRAGGLGLRLIRELMDEVTYSRPRRGGGNLLEMRKRLIREAAH